LLLSLAGVPGGEESGVGLAALGGALGAEAVVPAAEGDDGEVAVLVESGGGWSVGLRQGTAPWLAKTVRVLSLGSFAAALPDAGRYAK
jgi:hypothetical protein